jgi:ribose transport system ATP-binding protein
MKREITRLYQVTAMGEERDGAAAVGAVLNCVNLCVFQGEIMGLICVNSYGLETLIQVLCHSAPITGGFLYFDEKPVIDGNQRDAAPANKVFLMGTRRLLLKDLTVADNIFVMRRGFRKRLISADILERQLTILTRDLGISFQKYVRVADLNAFEQCVVELLRAVAAGAKLVILRDVGHIIGANDLARFHALIRRFAKDGLSFLYVSDDPRDVFQICDRAAVMENGTVLKVLSGEFLTEDKFPWRAARAAFGRAAHDVAGDAVAAPTAKCVADVDIVALATMPALTMADGAAPTPAFAPARKVVLEFRGVATESAPDVSFCVEERECAVLFDPDGMILKDVAGLLSGGVKPCRGEILVHGRRWNAKRNRREQNIMTISENPARDMVFSNMSYIDNLCFTLDRRQPFFWLNNRVRKGVRREYEPLLGRDVYLEDIGGLSRFAMYDLVYSRVCLCHPDVVICARPFANADMDLREHVMRKIRWLQFQGIAVVILTVNLPESLIPSGRVIRL